MEEKPQTASAATPASRNSDATSTASDSADQKQTVNTEVMTDVAQKIAGSQNVLIALSSDPSVDELATAIGLSMFLDRLGKRATAIYSGHTPNVLEFLKPNEVFETSADTLQDFVIALNKEKADHLRYKLDGDFVKIFITPYKTKISQDDLAFSYGDYNVDLVLALDVANGVDLDSALREHGRIMHDAVIINITTGNPGKLGEIEWSDKNASSVAEMITRLLFTVTNESLEDAEATAFLTGIVAATNRFSNAKTTPDTMEMASELMRSGANQQLVSQNITPDVDNELLERLKKEASTETPTAEKMDLASGPESNEPATPSETSTESSSETSTESSSETSSESSSKTPSESLTTAEKKDLTSNSESNEPESTSTSTATEKAPEPEAASTPTEPETVSTTDAETTSTPATSETASEPEAAPTPAAPEATSEPETSSTSAESAPDATKISISHPSGATATAQESDQGTEQESKTTEESTSDTEATSTQAESEVVSTTDAETAPTPTASEATSEPEVASTPTESEADAAATAATAAQEALAAAEQIAMVDTSPKISLSGATAPSTTETEAPSPDPKAESPADSVPAEPAAPVATEPSPEPTPEPTPEPASEPTPTPTTPDTEPASETEISGHTVVEAPSSDETPAPDTSALLDDLKAAEASLNDLESNVTPSDQSSDSTPTIQISTSDTIPEDNPSKIADAGLLPPEPPASDSEESGLLDSSSEAASPDEGFLKSNPEKNIQPPADFDLNAPSESDEFGKMLESALSSVGADTAAPAQAIISPPDNPAAAAAPAVASNPEINGVPEINYASPAGADLLPPPPAPPIDLTTSPMNMPPTDTVIPTAPVAPVTVPASMDAPVPASADTPAPASTDAPGVAPVSESPASDPTTLAVPTVSTPAPTVVAAPTAEPAPADPNAFKIPGM